MPRTNKQYKIFNRRRRDKLEALYNAGLPVKRIALELGYSEVSIYRELKRGFYMHRNSDWTETRRYSADKAQRDADYRATGKGAPLKIGRDRKFAAFVSEMILKHKYSPAAILAYINENKLEFETDVCRATLYNYIDQGIFMGVSVKDLLRGGKLKRKKKSSNEKTAKKLPNVEHSIERRPAEVAERNTFGHWELDSIIGTSIKGETLLSLTERLTRYQIILRSKDKSAASTVAALDRLERAVGGRKNFSKIFKTVTCDNGTEFSNVAGIETSPTGKQRTSVYYCHPYCSSERGSNENQNGFIRRFIPKGIPIKQFSNKFLRFVQNYINAYPREVLGWKNAETRFISELRHINLEKISKKIKLF